MEAIDELLEILKKNLPYSMEYIRSLHKKVLEAERKKLESESFFPPDSDDILLPIKIEYFNCREWLKRKS